ncbi:hypothetical protein SynBIOSE41_02776 [Synechococcus sp. BIOS-E4-1]|uniref:hypothetical protein n=1 Tax=Synechococcus sp. BIOS-E4-1 TaxID=1400864 RepID=UPI001648414A|nr:hypothetical protein [Synechococcus sp. BIOS-E4-1]QNI55265.1 hypothetical protein SynBIOSE41_02776 [Synechococcus sp. BIOS-E4-1]
MDPSRLITEINTSKVVALLKRIADQNQAGRSSLVLAKPPELKSKSPLTGQELLQML